MAFPDARKYLPLDIPDAAINETCQNIGLPVPSSIKPITAEAAYHKVYILQFATEITTEYFSQHLSHSTAHHHKSSLILRAAGTHFRTIKTRNECGVLKWIQQNTQIPVPVIVHYDDTNDNVLGCEYMLMTRLTGMTLDKIYNNSPDEVQMDKVVDQIIDIMQEFHKNSWDKIGGLREVEINGVKDIVPGPLVDETMWQIPELQIFWGGQVSFEDLNACGPFESYTDLVTAQVERYIFAIEHHNSLQPMRSTIPQIRAYLASIQNQKEELNRTKLRLAHRDLHFGNILYDTSTQTITGIIDWEFAAVVPFQRWDPSKAFLWNCVPSAEANQEKYARWEVVFKRCKERGVLLFKDAMFSGNAQENMQLAANFLRAIVEVLPRGETDKPWAEWKEKMTLHMKAVCDNDERK